MSHQSPKLYIRSVIKSPGPEFPPPIMKVSPTYFNRKIEESRTKQNPQLLDSPPTCIILMTALLHFDPLIDENSNFK